MSRVFMRFLFLHPLRLGWLSVFLTASALSAPIPGLFNTGVDNAGVPLANNAIDPHFRLMQSPDASAPGPNTFAVLDTVFPIAGGPWLANSSVSRWIGPMANQS